MATQTAARKTLANAAKLTSTGRDTEFVLKFAGRPDDISARTFLDALNGVASVIQEANRELGTGDPLDVRIRAPRPGSFLVNLLLDPVTASTIAALFTAHNLEIAKNLIDVVVAAID